MMLGKNVVVHLDQRFSNVFAWRPQSQTSIKVATPRHVFATPRDPNTGKLREKCPKFC